MSSLLEQVVEDLRTLSPEEQDRAAVVRPSYDVVRWSSRCRSVFRRSVLLRSVSACLLLALWGRRGVALLCVDSCSSFFFFRVSFVSPAHCRRPPPAFSDRRSTGL